MEPEIRKTFDKFQEILRKFNLGIYDFLRGASRRQLRLASQRFNLPRVHLVSLQKMAQGFRTLGLIDQDLDYARRYNPEQVPQLQEIAEDVRKQIE